MPSLIDSISRSSGGDECPLEVILAERQRYDLDRFNSKPGKKDAPKIWNIELVRAAPAITGEDAASVGLSH